VPAVAAEGCLESRPSPVAPGPQPPPGLHQLQLAGDVVALLGVPPGEPRPRPLLVFCHGAGGNAAQGLGPVRAAAAAAGVALLATTSVAATWDLIAGGLGRDVAVLDAALEEVTRRLPVSRCAIGGFSDGASYALSLGLANGDLFDAVLAFAPGFTAPPRRQGRPRILIRHGTRDPVLPVDRCGRRVASRLVGAGYEVSYEEFDGGHAVPPDLVAAALGWWLAG
jgi:phospholipase/carboxylesterase